MRLKARIKRLEADYQALRFWGPIHVYGQQLELIRQERQIAEHVAKVAATKQVMEALLKSPPAPPRPEPESPPTPKPELPPHPEERPAGPRLEGSATPRLVPTKARGLPRADRDASLRDAPQGEVMPPQEPVVKPFEPLQHGVVRWRIPGPDDHASDDDDEDREEEDYDPFADE